MNRGERALLRGALKQLIKSEKLALIQAIEKILNHLEGQEEYSTYAPRLKQLHSRALRLKGRNVRSIFQK